MSALLQILNDLLDPSHSNLRIREHKIKGAHIEGLREEVIISAEHALSLIARGEANRKVSESISLPLYTRYFP